MFRRRPEEPVDPERTGFEILDTDPLQEKTVKAVNELIGLQKELLAAELANDQQAVGELSLRMADIEGSIENHGEAAACAHVAAEAFEQEEGSLEAAIAAHLVRAKACFEMDWSDVGYSAFRDTVSVRQHIAAQTKEKLAAETDAAIIARHQPTAPTILESFQSDPNAWQTSLMRKMVKENSEAFQSWLQDSDEQTIARILRVLEESYQAGFAMSPLLKQLNKLTKDYTMSSDVLEQILVDLNGLQDYGPYPYGPAAERAMNHLGDIYHNLTLQPHIKAKQRRRALKESFLLRHAAEGVGANGHFSSPDSVPRPIPDVRGVKDAYRSLYENSWFGSITPIG